MEVIGYGGPTTLEQLTVEAEDNQANEQLLEAVDLFLVRAARPETISIKGDQAEPRCAPETRCVIILLHGKPQRIINR